MDVKLLDDLVGTTPERPEDFGVTVKEYADRIGCSIPQARYYLNGLVRNGILQAQNMHMSGKTGIDKVYSKKEVNNAP